MSLSLLPKTMKMSDVIDLKKKRNHQWKSDSRFIEGFDYEKPEVKMRGKKLREESRRGIQKEFLKIHTK